MLTLLLQPNLHFATEIEGEKLRIEARYYPFRRGTTDFFGVPEEPDEPEEINITGVFNQSGELVPYKDFEDELIDLGFEAIRNAV